VTKERSGLPTTKHSCNLIKPIPAGLRSEMKLSYYYQKYNEAYGIPVIASNKVAHNSLRRACYVLRFFLADRPEFKERMYRRSARVVLLGASETLQSVPEYKMLGLPSSWNLNVKGLSPTLKVPLITVSEDNVQCNNERFKFAPLTSGHSSNYSPNMFWISNNFRNDDLLIHQLSYALVSLDLLNPDMKTKLSEAYEKAKSSFSASSLFSMADKKEYLASAVSSFIFCSNTRQNGVMY
jgi:hypothetical protein